MTYEKLPPDEGLQLSDWRSFVKRLSRKVGKFRYFHAGEYGSRNGRPHDHAILFGVSFNDRKFFKTSQAGFPLYKSSLLEETWGKGFATVSEVSFEYAGYLARYLMEKPTLTKAVKDDDGITVGRTYTDQAIAKYGERVNQRTGEITLARRPEYLTMSRRPGIGESWLRKYWRDVYPHDFFTSFDGRKSPPPRYFDNKVAEWNLVDMEKIKLHRIDRCQKTEEVWSDVLQKMQVLDVNRDDRLAVMEEVKRAQLGLYNSERGAM